MRRPGEVGCGGVFLFLLPDTHNPHTLTAPATPLPLAVPHNPHSQNHRLPPRHPPSSQKKPRKRAKRGKKASSPSKKLEGEVLSGGNRGFWGRGGGGRLGKERVRRGSMGGDCVCLAGVKKKIRVNRVSGLPAPRFDQTRCGETRNSVQGGGKGALLHFCKRGGNRGCPNRD